MRALDLDQHMRKVGEWVDWENTCDRFLAGDPETQVAGIAVGWQARTAAVRRAIEIGCNLFVTHEPVFYDGKSAEHPDAQEKRKLIEDSGIVIYRCHDVWDRMPWIGIVDSWGSHLGLGEKMASDEFHAAYPSPCCSLTALGEYVASKTQSLGQDTVEVLGHPDAPVRTVGIGCGAITQYDRMIDLGADAIIGTDDGMSYWAGGAWAMDCGIGLVIVNHATAEEPGMVNLTWYLGQQFPSVPVSHIRQGCMFELASANASPRA